MRLFLQMIVFTILTAGVLVFSLSIPSSKVQAQDKILAYGPCFTLYQCQGASIGSYSDDQCRSMGGHSMLNGGICISL